MNLNARASGLCEAIASEAHSLRCAIHRVGGACVIDCGLRTPGGLEAGRRMAEVCLSGLGLVTLGGGDPSVWRGPWVEVSTDHPLAACMASQYAGWEVSGDGYSAIGSGPIRSAACREPLFAEAVFAGFREHGAASGCVGVLEASALPPESICVEIAEKCGVAPEQLTLLVAPTNSQAGSLQVVARSVETALHKLHELGFDLSRVESGWGAAPLPPVAGDALGGVGRTNDAILYGAHAVLYVRGDDASLGEIGPELPSNASADHGRPFVDLFRECGNDFFKIDKLLFSPAVVTLVNLDTGASFRFGRFEPGVLAQSFGVV